VVYFNGHLPVFTHAKTDLPSFRLFTSQLIVQGSATQGQIAKAFGVPLVAIKRTTKLFRERGSAGFSFPHPDGREPNSTLRSWNKLEDSFSRGTPYESLASRPECWSIRCAKR
jgi:hypothetical protein